MAKVKVEVLDAIVNGHSKGSKIEVEEKDAKHLVSIGYVKEVEQPKKAPAKAKAKEKEPEKDTKKK